MGNLPDVRVNCTTRAFVHVGVDYAGPILLRTAPGRGRKVHKAYIAVFVCMTTKGLHLEVVSDYSSAAFLAALSRFCARRGLPTTIYSDNGTTFQGADRELTETYQAVLQDPEIANALANRLISWRFIPLAAPHFGGLWEAAVRSVKNHLRRCIGTSTLTYEEMSTLLSRIEACLNSRPIAAVSENLDDYRALTPGHFLIGAPLIPIPEPSVLEVNEHRSSRWQLLQRLAETFWKAWSADYLHTLQQRPKWRARLHLARVGQLVLVQNYNAPPQQWDLGRISACHPGEDGITRVVTIRTSKTTLQRPINKVCFLPIDINTTDQQDFATASGNQPR